MFRTFLNQKITRSRVDAFLKKNATNKKTLDIGGSEGVYAKYFPNRTSLDIDKTKKGVDVVGDAHNLPFDDNSFEVVLCTEVLEHLHSPHIAVAEMKRVLKSGGKVILTTRFVYPIHDAPHDYFRYTAYGLKHLFSDWEIEELSNETSTMEAFAVLFQTVAAKTTMVGGICTRILLLLDAQITRRLNWMIQEERTSGRHGEKRTEKAIMSSGYHLVAINKK